MKTKVLILLGTRPEAVKMAPVVAALRQRPASFHVSVCATAQHREMLDQVLRIFGVSPDIDLDLMREDQGLNDLATRMVPGVDRVLAELKPDWLLVQGDTTTAMVGALAAFHRGVRIGHVEAGLRSGDLKRPFPEEGNRRIVDALADALFAPTELARSNLLSEGVPAEKVFLTGNTVIDAVQGIAGRLPGTVRREEVLVTLHRRELFGPSLEEVLRALRELADAFPGKRWVYPVHPNPNVEGPARRLLGGVPNIELRSPMGYPEFVEHLTAAILILTDSGGVQEEAAAVSTPVLVLRDVTERPEGVSVGAARLVGTSRKRIVEEAAGLLNDEPARRAMARAPNPYGDGKASDRIAAILAGEASIPFELPGLGRVAAAPVPR